MSQINIPARKPFNFLSVVNSHGWRQLAPFHFDPQTETLSYILSFLSGRVEQLSMRAAPGGVWVEVNGRLSNAERIQVTETVTWMLGLDMDFSPFHAAARREPKLARARRLAYGRLLRSPTLFEDVVKTILTTNTLWAATRNMSFKLTAEFGSAPDADPVKKAFPSPGQIAASNPGALREKIRVGYRAPAIHELAGRVACGALDLEAYKTSALPTLELRKELMKLNGIGPYAAANLLMLLGRHDFIPIDSSALSAVSAEWYRGKPVTAQHVERRFKKWGEYKGLAYWFWDWKKDQY
jgi:3-methyladenine DNA glycosylase/8-oxoguanine DNA glycosylase